MDSLILGFTPEQYSAYLKIKNSDKADLNFNLTVPKVSPYSDDTLRSEIQSIAEECDFLLNLQGKNKSFFSSISNEQMAEIISAYYHLVSNVARSRNVIYGETVSLAEAIKHTERAHSELCAEYSSFLPYRAALCEKEEYAEQIKQTDFLFKESISRLQDLKEQELALLSTINKVCDIFIPDFFEETKNASSSPKFNNFQERAFFGAIRSFAERLKSI